MHPGPGCHWSEMLDGRWSRDRYGPGSLGDAGPSYDVARDVPKGGAHHLAHKVCAMGVVMHHSRMDGGWGCAVASGSLRVVWLVSGSLGGMLKGLGMLSCMLEAHGSRGDVSQIGTHHKTWAHICKTGQGTCPMVPTCH